MGLSELLAELSVGIFFGLSKLQKLIRNFLRLSELFMGLIRTFYRVIS